MINATGRQTAAVVGEGKEWEEGTWWYDHAKRGAVKTRPFESLDF
jgi:hypothetical protein